MYIIDNSITKTRKFILVTYTRDSKMSRKKKTCMYLRPRIYFI